MKKLFVILFAVCLTSLFGQSLLADPVSPSRALEAGRRILDGPATRGSASEVSILCITWVLETNEESQASPRLLNQISHVNQIPW